MKIKDILAKGQPTLSFEVFPPKEESNFASVEKAALEIAKLNPSFMSVTYGAGGGTSQYTVQIASDIQSTCQVPALSHLTCVSSTREKVHSVLREIQAHGIENVLALRGQNGFFSSALNGIKDNTVSRNVSSISCSDGFSRRL